MAIIQPARISIIQPARARPPGLRGAPQLVDFVATARRPSPPPTACVVPLCPRLWLLHRNPRGPPAPMYPPASLAFAPFRPLRASERSDGRLSRLPPPLPTSYPPPLRSPCSPPPPLARAPTPACSPPPPAHRAMTPSSSSTPTRPPTPTRSCPVHAPSSLHPPPATHHPSLAASTRAARLPSLRPTPRERDAGAALSCRRLHVEDSRLPVRLQKSLDRMDHHPARRLQRRWLARHRADVGDDRVRAGRTDARNDERQRHAAEGAGTSTRSLGLTLRNPGRGVTGRAGGCVLHHSVEHGPFGGRLLLPAGLLAPGFPRRSPAPADHDESPGHAANPLRLR